MPGDADRGYLTDVALAAAVAGGRVVLAGSGKAEAEVKAAGDYVTAVDRDSEAAVIRALSGATRAIPVVGEEGGGDRGPRWWVVDPLDGTTNFLLRFPAVGVSVALIEDGEPVVGVVHAPFLRQTWAGAAGLGARVIRADGRTERLAVSSRPVRRAVVGTGFPFRRKDLVPRYLDAFGRAFERFEDLRRPGAASLDLAWVAEGVFDGFFELALGTWDVAAGGLLIREAGGVVSDWGGGGSWLDGDVLAGSVAVHEALVEVVRGPSA